MSSPTSQDTTTFLQVSEIERLAKAGVQITLGNIIPQSDMMMAEAASHYPTPSTASDAFWDRWRRAHRNQEFTFQAPFGIHATEFGGKVYVLVSPHDEAPFILEDDALLYPSDALMASLALRERTK